MADIKQWRGLRALLEDAVEQGASAVERVHVATAKRPFEILKRLPPIGKWVEGVEAVHDTIVAGAYGSVRVVNRVVGKALDVALDAFDDARDGDHPDDAAGAASPDTAKTPVSAKTPDDEAGP